MFVVFGFGWLGVLLYEVVGYGLEGDFNCKGLLVFVGKVGKKVIFDLCMIVDDGIFKDLCGFFNVDDEGVSG